MVADTIPETKVESSGLPEAIERATGCREIRVFYHTKPTGEKTCQVTGRYPLGSHLVGLWEYTFPDPPFYQTKGVLCRTICEALRVRASRVRYIAQCSLGLAIVS